MWSLTAKCSDKGVTQERDWRRWEMLKNDWCSLPSYYFMLPSLDIVSKLNLPSTVWTQLELMLLGLLIAPGWAGFWDLPSLLYWKKTLELRPSISWIIFVYSIYGGGGTGRFSPLCLWGIGVLAQTCPTSWEQVLAWWLVCDILWEA